MSVLPKAIRRCLIALVDQTDAPNGCLGDKRMSGFTWYSASFAQVTE